MHPKLHDSGLWIFPGGPLVFWDEYHPRKRTFKTHPKHIVCQVWKYTLIMHFCMFFFLIFPSCPFPKFKWMRLGRLIDNFCWHILKNKWNTDGQKRSLLLKNWAWGSKKETLTVMQYRLDPWFGKMAPPLFAQNLTLLRRFYLQAWRFIFLSDLHRI